MTQRIIHILEEGKVIYKGDLEQVTQFLKPDERKLKEQDKQLIRDVEANIEKIIVDLQEAIKYDIFVALNFYISDEYIKTKIISLKRELNFGEDISKEILKRLPN